MNETPATVRMIEGATAPVISNVFVNNACAVCTLQITGSFTAATVLVEGIVNVASNQWVTLAAFNLSDLSLEKDGADKAGIYQVGIEGILRVRINVTEVTGGDITIAAQFGNATINQFSETEASNLVPITAYDLAVAGGYTGTLEQFEADMGNSASNATAAANSADEAADSAESVSASAAQIATNTSDISELKTQIDSLIVPMILDFSDERNAYSDGAVGSEITYINTTASKTFVKIISICKGNKYTINVTYGSEVEASNTRQSKCIDTNNIVTQSIPVPVVINTTQSVSFTAIADGYLSLTVDAKYAGIEIVGIDPYAPKKIEGQIETINEKTDSIENTVNDSTIKAKLVSCLRNMGWINAHGANMLTNYCESIGIDGWIDVKPNSGIDSTTGETTNEANYRQATGFINVNGFSSFYSEFEDSAGRAIYYSVRCYNQEKEYVGTAADGGGSTGAESGSIPRSFIANTYYIRLLLTPDTTTEPTLDLNGVYTGRVIKMSFVDNNTTTEKKYALVEVEDFDV